MAENLTSSPICAVTSPGAIRMRFTGASRSDCVSCLAGLRKYSPVTGGCKVLSDPLACYQKVKLTCQSCVTLTIVSVAAGVELQSNDVAITTQTMRFSTLLMMNASEESRR